ncbi:MAG TPA: DUF1549 domain-containing protein, partial [Candidatus Obscuribacter sp.]|nr:DUF1549 domain-containing protein [Candidatus Obscuribacter sp.]
MKTEGGKEAQLEAADEQSKLSPMMRQYWDVKSQYPDALLFFRVGDFYELFDSDAQVASRELDIMLTGRPEPNYPNGRCPMAGVPYRAYEAYVDRLLASPHYGERWARAWLDLARYSDTNGYEKDRQRSIWPYRDWV